MNFYENLKKICEDRGMTISGVAQKAGMSNGITTSWKKGTIPNTANLQKIAAVLNVSVSEITGEKCDLQKGFLLPVVEQKSLSVKNYIAYYNIGKSEEQIAAIRFEDDSMIPRVYPGVIAIYDKQEQPHNGDYAIVQIGDENPTIRLYVEIDDIVSILPMSTDYPGKTFPKSQSVAASVKIIGKIIEFRREL